jgi:NAD(P)-dependent dehydrogenase (short-subunit alcohol dehydrogenase family)
MRRAQERGHLFKDLGDRVHLLSLDVTNPPEVTEAVRSVRAVTGGVLHALVNNAGFGMFGPIETAADDEVRRQFEVNVFGLIRVTREFLPLLREARGTIVNISSILGRCSAPNTGLYAGSKFAVEAITEALFYELAPQGVRAFAIGPGLFKTNFGDNSQWTSASYDCTSPYFNLCERHRARLASFRSTAFGRPDAVARLVREVSEGRVGGVGRTIGYDAAFVNAMRALLPRRLLVSLTSFIYRNLFLKDDSSRR